MPIIKKILIGSVVFLVTAIALLVILAIIIPTPKNVMFGGANSGRIIAPSMGVSSSVPLGAPVQSDMVAKGVPEVAPSPASDSSFVQDAIDKKIIKNGYLTVNVKNADEASGKITQIAKDNGGDVFSSNFFEIKKDVKSGNITVKVPVANFENTYNEIKKVATLVVQESTSGQDVTEEYADLQSQLKNKQAEEQQFVQILGQAQKIQDILDVTQQLSRVRGEIEQLQGRIKFLHSQTDLASISVSITEDANITVTNSWRPWQVFKDSVNRLIKEGQVFINSVIFLIVVALPIILIYLLLLYILYIIGRKIYRKIKGKKEEVQ
jgi:hypothetical protein